MNVRNYVLFLVLNLFGLISYSQKNLHDSLAWLVKTKKEDTSKIQLYYDFGALMALSNSDSAIYYYKKAKKLSDQFNHIKGKITYASVYGSILNEQGKLKESYELGLEALRLAEKHKLYYEKAKTCNNIANVFNYMGEFDSSMIYFLRSASIFENLKRTEHLNVIYQNIGSVYLNLGDYEKSIGYSEKSIALSRKKNDFVSEAYTLTNLGGAYASRNDYSKALAAFTNSLDICKKYPNPYIENMALVGLGNVYTQQKKFDSAIKVLEQARETAQELDYTNNLANALNALALVYFETGNYNKANTYATQAVSINEQYQVYNNLRQQYKLISDIHAKLGLYRSSHDYLLKYVSLNDSLSGIEEKKNVARLEKEYKTAEKDKQIAENKLEVELKDKSIRKKNTWLFISLSLVLLLILCLILAYYWSVQKQKFHVKNLEAIQKDQELMQLKASLEGQQIERQRIAREMHDEIGSGLSIIHLLSNNLGYQNEKTMKVAETSNLLINQMNEIIWSMNLEQDNLEDFVTYIRYQSGQMLSSVNMDYVFEIPDEIPKSGISGIKRRNIYLVVKEALHNIIKHSGASLVNIKMNFENGILITISDNGKGIPENMLDAGNPYGNGMKNMFYRMNEIGGEWEITHHQPFTLEIKLKEEHLL